MAGEKDGRRVSGLKLFVGKVFVVHTKHNFCSSKKHFSWFLGNFLGFKLCNVRERFSSANLELEKPENPPQRQLKTLQTFLTTSWSSSPRKDSVAESSRLLNALQVPAVLQLSTFCPFFPPSGHEKERTPHPVEIPLSFRSRKAMKKAKVIQTHCDFAFPHFPSPLIRPTHEKTAESQHTIKG